MNSQKRFESLQKTRDAVRDVPAYEKDMMLRLVARCEEIERAIAHVPDPQMQDRIGDMVHDLFTHFQTFALRLLLTTYQYAETFHELLGTSIIRGEYRAVLEPSEELPWGLYRLGEDTVKSRYRTAIEVYEALKEVTT